MGIVVRQAVKSLLVVFAGTVLGVVITLLGPYLMEDAELGFSRNIVNQTNLLQFVSLFGFNSTLAFFWTRYPAGDARRAGLLQISFGVSVALWAIIVLPYFFLKPFLINQFYQPADRALAHRFYWVLPVLLLLFTLHSLLDGLLFALKRQAVIAFAREILIRCTSLLLLVGMGLSLLNFQQFMVLHILMFLLPVVFLAFIVRRSFPAFGGSIRTLPKATLREWMQFSGFHMLTGVALNLTGMLDSLLLPVLDRQGLASLAVYSIALFVATVAAMPYRAMSGAAVAVMNEHMSRGELDTLKGLYTRTTTNILLATTFFILLIGVNLPFIEGLLPPRYQHIRLLVLVLLAGRWIDVCTGPNTEVLSMSGRYRFVFGLTVLLIFLMVSGNYLLIPRIGALGAALSTAGSLLIFNGAKAWYLHRHFGILPFSAATLKIGAAAGVSLLVLLLPSTGLAWLDLLIRSAVTTLLFGGCVFLLRASPDLIDYLQNLRRERRLF